MKDESKSIYQLTPITLSINIEDTNLNELFEDIST